MAIELEFINLVIPLKNINKCYPGGFTAFCQQYQHMFGGKLWHDEYLFRDGAMNSSDVQHLVEFWQDKGLIPFEIIDGKKVWKDMCIVEAFFGGPTLPCDWIEYDRESNCVYLRGTPRGNIIGRKKMKEYCEI